MKEDIISKIDDLVLGRLSKSEADAVRSTIDQDPELKDYYLDSINLMQASRIAALREKKEMLEALETNMTASPSAPKPKNRPKKNGLLKAATAAILLLLAIASYFYFESQEPSAGEQLYVEHFQRLDHNLFSTTRSSTTPSDNTVSSKRKQAYNLYSIDDADRTKVAELLEDVYESEGHLIDLFYAANAYLEGGNIHKAASLLQKDFSQVPGIEAGELKRTKVMLALRQNETGKAQDIMKTMSQDDLADYNLQSLVEDLNSN